MRVLVSGGGGRVGRGIVAHLLSAGHQVIVAARRPPDQRLFPRAPTFRWLDLDPAADISGLFSGVDAFVHAAFAHVPGRYRGGEGGDPDRFRVLNLTGTIKLFDAARQAGVARVVFLSSRAVYDNLPDGLVPHEDQPLTPAHLYAEIKLLAEDHLKAMAADGFVPVSLRATGVYDARAPNKWDELVDDYLAGRPVAARAGGEVHGEDIGQAARILLEAEAGLVAGRPFNASDILVDTRDILAIVRSVAGVDHPLPEQADKDEVRLMPTARLLALGWQPGRMALFEETVTALAKTRLGRT